MPNNEEYKPNSSFLNETQVKDVVGEVTLVDVLVDGQSVVPTGTGKAYINLTGKQDKLISGENIKTIHGISILGEGNIDVVGPTGPQGEQGEDGDIGPTGPQGPAGQLGPTGPKGDAGEAGPQGPKGDTGPTGAQGLTGPTGKDGTSVSHIWNGTTLIITSAAGTSSADLVGPAGQNGHDGQPGTNGITPHIGDNENWYIGELDTGIKARGENGHDGQPGEPGQQGPTGDAGQEGPIGPTGPQGIPGNKGPTGDTGSIGPTGEMGPTGEKGEKGDQGIQGPVGPTGLTGLTGNDGPTGEIGPTGPEGPQGPTGEAGALGPTGPQGEQGDLGPTGPQGPTGTAGKDGLTTSIRIGPSGTIYTQVDGLITLPDTAAPGDGTLTIQKNSVSIGTFKANASADKSINITVPINTNELTNGAGFITNTANNLTNYTKTSDLSAVAISGDYNDLSNTPIIPVINYPVEDIKVNNVSVLVNKVANIDLSVKQDKIDSNHLLDYSLLDNTPSIPSKTSDLTNDSGFITGVSWTDINGKPTFATVATSGDYNDLSNKPTIPSIPVTDVQVNGISVLTNTVANVDISGKQNILTTSSVTDGTPVSVIGFNSSNALVKGIFSANPVQDLTANSSFIVSAENWVLLKANHSLLLNNISLVGLDTTKEFVNIKGTIANLDNLIKLNKNALNKYAGLFFIEENEHLYELAVYYNNTLHTLALRCALVY